jgi:CIC family chloride channel protein
VTVIGAMAGGAFGEILHALLPGSTAPSGAYAMVGMGGAVAALTRGPLTGLMMVYELSGNYAIILPLMVTCTIASALCHALVERRAGGDVHALRRSPVRALVVWVEPVGPGLPASVLRERLLTGPVSALPVLGADGQLLGVVTASTLGERWRSAGGESTVAALADLARPVSPDTSLGDALAIMDAQAVDALPIQGEEQVGVVTRTGLERFLESAKRKASRAEPAFTATEIPR